MMTTSVSFSLVAMFQLPMRAEAGGRLRERVVVVRRLVVRLEIFFLQTLLFGRGHHGSDAGIADQIPADEIRVATVVRIPERALMRVRQHEPKEHRGAFG